jgi:hypothetical protein
MQPKVVNVSEATGWSSIRLEAFYDAVSKFYPKRMKVYDWHRGFDKRSPDLIAHLGELRGYISDFKATTYTAFSQIEAADAYVSYLSPELKDLAMQHGVLPVVSWISTRRQRSQLVPWEYTNFPERSVWMDSCDLATNTTAWWISKRLEDQNSVQISSRSRGLLTVSTAETVSGIYHYSGPNPVVIQCYAAHGSTGVADSLKPEDCPSPFPLLAAAELKEAVCTPGYR